MIVLKEVIIFISFVVNLIIFYFYSDLRFENYLLSKKIDELNLNNLELIKDKINISNELENQKIENQNLLQKYNEICKSKKWDLIPISFESILKFCLIGGAIYLGGCGAISIYKFYFASLDSSYAIILKQIHDNYINISESLKLLPTSEGLDKIFSEIVKLQNINHENIKELLETTKSMHSVIKLLQNNSIIGNVHAIGQIANKSKILDLKSSIDFLDK